VSKNKEDAQNAVIDIKPNVLDSQKNEASGKAYPHSELNPITDALYLALMDPKKIEQVRKILLGGSTAEQPKEHCPVESPAASEIKEKELKSSKVAEVNEPEKEKLSKRASNLRRELNKIPDDEKIDITDVNRKNLLNNIAQETGIEKMIEEAVDSKVDKEVAEDSGEGTKTEVTDTKAILLEENEMENDKNQKENTSEYALANDEQESNRKHQEQDNDQVLHKQSSKPESETADEDDATSKLIKEADSPYNLSQLHSFDKVASNVAEKPKSTIDSILPDSNVPGSEEVQSTYQKIANMWKNRAKMVDNFKSEAQKKTKEFTSGLPFIG